MVLLKGSAGWRFLVGEVPLNKKCGPEAGAWWSVRRRNATLSLSLSFFLSLFLSLSLSLSLALSVSVL